MTHFQLLCLFCLRFREKGSTSVFPAQIQADSNPIWLHSVRLCNSTYHWQPNPGLVYLLFYGPAPLFHSRWWTQIRLICLSPKACWQLLLSVHDKLIVLLVVQVPGVLADDPGLVSCAVSRSLTPWVILGHYDRNIAETTRWENAVRNLETRYPMLLVLVPSQGPDNWPCCIVAAGDDVVQRVNSMSNDVVHFSPGFATIPPVCGILGWLIPGCDNDFVLNLIHSGSLGTIRIAIIRGMELSIAQSPA